MAAPLTVALEVGKQRVFATALDWPGLCRSGRDEASALAALLSYAPRYANALSGHVRGFRAPRSLDAIAVTERIDGNSGTDFGVPGIPSAVDAQPVTARDLKRLEAFMQACWDTFDAAAAAAEGAALRTGPRGGGRDLSKIRAHVHEAGKAYIRAVGGASLPDASIEEARVAFIEAIYARAHGEVPDTGPRGGKRWSPRFAVRYAAWHVLDHAWEIEDRALP